MKKILYILVTIFMFSLLKTNVYASSFDITLDGDNNFSDEISIDIIVSNLTDFSNGFYGLDATLSYDKTKIELKEITTSASYELTYDKTVTDRFVILTDTGVTNGTTLATLVFQNKSLVENESTTITLNNLIGSDGDNDILSNKTSSKLLTLNDAPTYTKGDLNKDGKIGLQDIIYLLKRYLNLEPTTAEDIIIGDMDDNGSLGLKDIILLLKEYLGIN